MFVNSFSKVDEMQHPGNESWRTLLKLAWTLHDRKEVRVEGRKEGWGIGKRGGRAGERGLE